jgi:hypothetical protein
MLLFRSRAVPAEYFIAMRKASEAGYHVPVCNRVIAIAVNFRSNLFIAIPEQLVEQFYAFFLDRQILAVFIGDVQEHAVNGGHVAIKPAGDRILNQCQGLAIAGECLRRAAVYVAGELIQQQHQGH